VTGQAVAWLFSAALAIIKREHEQRYQQHMAQHFNPALNPSLPTHTRITAHYNVCKGKTAH